jgi:hypothetical protein
VARSHSFSQGRPWCVISLITCRRLISQKGSFAVPEVQMRLLAELPPDPGLVPLRHLDLQSSPSIPSWLGRVGLFVFPFLFLFISILFQLLFIILLHEATAVPLGASVPPPAQLVELHPLVDCRDATRLCALS